MPPLRDASWIVLAALFAAGASLLWGCQSKLAINESMRQRTTPASETSEPAVVDDNFEIVLDQEEQHSSDVSVRWDLPSAESIASYSLSLSTKSDCSDRVHEISLTDKQGRFSGVADGAYFLCMVATAKDGKKIAPKNNGLRLVVDTTPPVITIATAALSTGVSRIALAGTCEAGLTLNVTGTGVSAPSAQTCDGGSFAFTVLFSAGLGTKAVTISQSDAAGNSASTSRDFTRIEPQATIAGSPGSGSIVAAGNYHFTVSGTDVTSYKYALLNDVANCESASWSSAVLVATPLSGTTSSGNKRLCVKGIAGESTGAADSQEQSAPLELTWTVDPTVPVATLSNFPAAIASLATFNITVSGAAVSTYKFGIIEGSSSNCNGVTYSSWTPVATPISGTLTQRDARICVLGGSVAQVEQGVPTEYFWQNTVYDAAPTVTTNTGMTIAEGAAATTITSAMLAASDSDHGAPELTYTIVTLPSQGQIRRNTTPLAVGATFTQSEIDSNTINYLHTLKASPQTFTVGVRDPLGIGPANTNFSISVTPHCTGTALTNAPFAGGSGTAGDPYLLCTRTQFNQIGANATYVSKHYRQYADIDFSSGMTRIADPSQSFSGSYDGRGYALANVTYGTAATTYNAVFAIVAASGVLANINVSNAAVVGYQFVGILAGKNAGIISNATVSGSVELSHAGSLNKNIGGAVGENSGVLDGVTGNVTLTIESTTLTPQFVGGLVGINLGQIRNCSSTGSLSGTGLSAPSASSGNSNFGGLVGENDGTIDRSSSSVAVSVSGTGTNLRAVGGLVGTTWTGAIVTNSYATGAVTAEIAVGGLIGDHEGSVGNSYATGAVTTTATTAAGAGGLVGRSGFFSRIAQVSRSFATGSVTASGAGGSRFGGLVGANYSNIEDSYASGAINAGALTVAGALVGLNHSDGSVLRSYSKGTVTAGAPSVGAMVGTNSGLLSSLVWDGDLNTRTTMCGDGSGTGCVDGNMKTTAAMNTKSTFTALSWDFAQIEGGADTDGVNDDWVIASGSYPTLSWHYASLGNSVPAQPLPQFTSGTGTPGDPYIISTPAQLASIGRRPSLMSKSFTLANGLDMTGQSYKPIGHPVDPYSGTFDGAGYTITNLNLTHYTTGAGLFGVLKTNAVIKNVNLASPAIVGGNGIGPVAGIAFGSTTADSIQLNSVVVTGGSVSGIGAYVGGVAGGIYYTTADKSGSSAAVTVTAGHNRCDYAGGFSGFVAQSAVTKSYARGNVTTNGGSNGGFFGWAEGSSISDSYATGFVTGKILSTSFPENGCSTALTWSLIGGFGGTVYSDLGASALHRVYATGATNGGTGVAVGGLVGMVGISSAWSFTNSFATGAVTGTSTTINGVIGTAYSRVAQDTSTYYASTGGTGKANGAHAFSGTQYSANAGIDISAGTGDPTYFFNKLNAPLSSWDFTPGTGVWVEQALSYPKLAWEP